MIVTRAPLRISFVGGGTDLPAFYKRYPGRVISATINKYVYVTVHSTPLLDKFIVRYSKTETVTHPKDLEHTRVREALLDLGLTEPGIEIATFADLPARTGLGGSSSFSAALLKGLYARLGKKLNAEDTACGACRLEIELLKEPIGKQDQYAASYGGFNVIQFNEDESVHVRPVYLDYRTRSLLEDHILLFFTGITRSAAGVLEAQNKELNQKLEIYKQMSHSVFEFEKMLLEGDVEGMGRMLHDGWLLKKSLSRTISSSLIDAMYEAGRSAGAWGGKILGAGGGGCILFLADPRRHDAIRNTVTDVALGNNLMRSDDPIDSGFRETPVRFVQSGADVLFNQKE